ncbi:MAG TPA: SCO family protein [Vicinamibacterales bacterium]|nr:SCO family protein [Vicinamibacterales bacterium]
MKTAVALVVLFGMVAVAAPIATAQVNGAPAAGYRPEAGVPSSTVPPALREIGFDQNLDGQMPLNTPFKDEAGRTVKLGDYFGTRPVVMVFAYYDCPMLCTVVINGLASALNVLSLQPGSDFEIVTVSFNPRDTPATASAKKASYIARYKQPGGAGAWHFLTGDQRSIDRVTKAAGFRYVWDQDTQQFAHPTGVMVLTPDGRLARYLFGIEYGPRDLRYAIVDASKGKVGSAVDSLALYCYHYDPAAGKYTVAIMRLVRAGGAATVLALGAFIFIMTRKERQEKRAGA